MAKRKASAGTATTTARSKKAAKTSNTNNNRDSEPDRLVVDHRHESSSPNPQVPVDNIHYDNGPYPRQEYNHHNLHSLDIDPRLDIMNHHFHMGNDGTGSGGSMDAAMMGNTDEGDNRSRNAKAQRRHREKRKAHLKALEDSVQLLTAQLEDARRQLGQAAYITGNRPGGPAGSAPLSPQQTKDNNQAQAENAYLRDENADLRRQLYAYRVSYPPPPPSVGKDGNGDWNEVKPEAFMYAPGGSPGRRSGGPRGSNEVGPVNSGESGTSTADGSSGPNSANASNQNSNGYPVDHFANMHQRSRSRVPSASSAPSASPYMPSDPRSMDARYAPPPNVRYEPQSGMYNAPPPHAVPRYDPSAGPDGHQQHSGHYGRPDGHNGVSWPPEQNGPPPFTAYGMGFPHDSQGQQQQSEDWRQEH